MRKVTKDDIRFVLDNFDSEGRLFDPTDTQYDYLKSLVNTGHVRYRFNCVNKWYYEVYGPLLTPILSKSVSEICGNIMIALIS